MVTRKISTKRHVLAIILAVLIFVTGVTLGAFVNKERVDDLQQKSDLSRMDFDSLQVQYLFLTSVFEKEKNCKAAETILEENVNSLEVLGSKLSNYISEQVLTNEEGFISLKREYTLAELRYLLFAKQFKESCDSDNVIILYFYSNEDCDSCETQGVILSYLKGKFKDKLLNFALDINFVQEPMITILKNTYDINETPTLIINDEKYEGFYSQEELIQIICPLYKSEIPECKNIGGET